MDPARLLDDLNDAQRAAVTSTARPLCILAGAGSGKTRVLTRRIGHRVATGDADPRHVLALTFTRKAAGELNTRLRALGLRDSVAAGTFHSVAYAQLRARWVDRGVTPPELLDRKVGFVGGLIPRRAQAVDVVGEIEWAKARRIAPDRYVAEAAAAERTPPIDAYDVARYYEAYEEAKRRRRMVDFDDLLGLAIRDLTTDPEFAAAQRWRFRHLFVDEFQDVNPLQFDLLGAWLGERLDLCVVGDPNQAIYAWNGADPRYLTHLEHWFPTVERVELLDNYRSSPQILAAANALLASSRSRSSLLRANRPAGPSPTIASHPTDTDEATAIARALRDRHTPGSRWSSQAVLVRTNAQGLLIAEALQTAGIPHRVRGGAALLDQPEIRTALANLRRHRGPFHGAVADLAVSLGERPDAAADPDGSPTTGDTSDAVAQRHANLEMLVRLADDYQRIDPAPSASAFVEWLRTTISSEDPDRDAVDITTFHAAKGLEWPIVHVAGLEQGLVPIGHAKTASALAEERRLFYVALTRAEHELVCTWAEQRTFGQRSRPRDPSPYLEALAHAAGQGDDVPADWRAFLRAERAKLAAAGPGRGGGARRSRQSPPELSPDDQAVFDALKQWRATKARAANVPAYVIFNDATLAAIASKRPSSPQQLLTLPGIGPVKVERHGPEVLSVVAEHA
jgi:DNA helicase II / ATP-dependent DNA helicase PcrA